MDDTNWGDMQGQYIPSVRGRIAQAGLFFERRPISEEL